MGLPETIDYPVVSYVNENFVYIYFVYFYSDGTWQIKRDRTFSTATIRNLLEDLAAHRMELWIWTTKRDPGLLHQTVQSKCRVDLNNSV